MQTYVEKKVISVFLVDKRCLRIVDAHIEVLVNITFDC